MRTLRNDPAFVDNHDLVGFQDGADALSHHETGV